MMRHLDEYLNDHLAGSVGALEMLDHLIDAYAGKPIADLMRTLRNEIQADQHELEKIMLATSVKKDPLKNAVAWFAEKISRLKTRITGKDEGQIGLFMALEALALGITGKYELWTVLDRLSGRLPALQAHAFSTLKERALDQRKRVDDARLSIAAEALLT